MRKRNIQIIIHLDREERERLKKLVKRTGFSQEGYIRSLINGYVPADLPPPEYHLMMDELRAIGRNMNQIAQKAHVLNVIDTRKYDETFALLKQSLIDISGAITMPHKIERKRE